VLERLTITFPYHVIVMNIMYVVNLIDVNLFGIHANILSKYASIETHLSGTSWPTSVKTVKVFFAWNKTFVSVPLRGPLKAPIECFLIVLFLHHQCV